MGEPPQMAEAASPRRPHTVVPSAVVEVSSEELLMWTDQQLRDFAELQLSIVFPGGTPRQVMLSKIVAASLVIADA